MEFLSEELLIHIFNYLDFNSILSCLLVSKRWNYLINYSSVSRNKLVFDFDLFRMSLRHELRNSNVNFIENKKVINAVITFNSVKYFLEFYKIFTKLNYETLHINLIGVEFADDLDNHKRLKRIFENQKNLKELRISNHQISDLFRCDLSSDACQFQLEKFVFKNHVVDEILCYEKLDADDKKESELNLLNFLYKHCKKLKSITINSKISDEVCRFIFNQMQTLKELTFYIESIPFELKFYDEVNMMPNIKLLRAWNSPDYGDGCTEKYFEDSVKFDKFLRKMPGIEDLQVDILWESTIEVLQKHHKKLHKLSIFEEIYRESRSPRDINLQIPTVKTLFTSTAWDFHRDFIYFICCNPTIENFNQDITGVIRMGRFNSSYYGQLLRDTEIKHINITSECSKGKYSDRLKRQFLFILENIGWNKLETLDFCGYFYIMPKLENKKWWEFSTTRDTENFEDLLDENMEY